MADTFGAAFDMQTGVTSDGDDDPRKDGAFDHAGIQIPGIGTLQRAQHVTGGVEIEREPANGPTAKNANVISENGEGRKHDEHGEKTWHDEVLDRIDRHHLKRFDFFGHFHRAEFRRDSRAAAADDDHRDQDRSHLTQDRQHDEIGDEHFRTELLQRVRSLHGERHTHTERSQRDHRRCAHADEDHLPEDRRDFEKLPGERRDKYPVKKAQIEAKIIFQSRAVRPRRMPRCAK